MQHTGSLPKAEAAIRATEDRRLSEPVVERCSTHIPGTASPDDLFSVRETDRLALGMEREEYDEWQRRLYARVEALVEPFVPPPRSSDL